MIYERPILHSKVEDYSEELKEVMLAYANDYVILKQFLVYFLHINPYYRDEYDNLITELQEIIKREDFPNQ